MTGTLALQGGGPFVANDELDARLLSSVGAGRIVMLPTADAYEHPERLVTAALSWAERLGVEVEALMVMRRAEALDESAISVVRNARAVYFVGDQPLHLRSVLKNTPLWAAVGEVLAEGGLVAACAGSAGALCDPMVDPRGGGITIGLGMQTGVALVTEAETWSLERLHRTLKLANTTLATLPTGAALVRTPHGWEQVGAVGLHGDLPAIA
jgi:cyanophycinase